MHHGSTCLRACNLCLGSLQGHPLLEDASGTIKRCTEHMLVYHDARGRPSWQPSTVPLSHVFATANAHQDRLLMLFNATTGGYPCKVLLDSGATANIVSQSLAQRLHLDVSPSTAHLTFGAGNTESVVGQCTLPAVHVQQACLSGTCLVVKTRAPDVDIIFGCNWLRAHSATLSFQTPVHARVCLNHHWHDLNAMTVTCPQPVNLLSAAIPEQHL